MLDFMDYIQLAFSDASGWNRDNSYSALTDTANALLDFSTPERLQVNLSSLSTPQFATTYTLGTVGLIDGSISYLFSTLPLNDTPSRSTRIPLRRLVPGYRQIYAPTSPLENANWLKSELGNKFGDEKKQKDTLLHATLHLPPPTTLTGLFLRRLSPTTQLSLALSSTRATSISKSAPQASLLTQISHDTGKYSSDFLFSTDNALFGFKGLWNFGPDPRHPEQDGKESDKIPSLLSAGGEAYYSPVSSVIGLSTGLRFTTLPADTEPSTSTPGSSQSSSPISTFPYTLTLTLTPLTGSLSTTYSLLASPNLALSSRFGFNVYSWESEMVAGCELWRRKKRSRTASSTRGIDNLDWAREKMGLPTSAVPFPSSPASTTKEARPEDEDSGSDDSVLKARVDQSWNIRVLWEGRVKELLVSAGVGLGPLSRSSLSSPTHAPSGGGPSGLGSYGWTSVGVSVLYSS